MRMGGVDRHHFVVRHRLAVHPSVVCLFVGQHERQHESVPSSSGRAATAMQIVLVIAWWVEVDNQIDSVDMDAASGNVSRHQDRSTPAGEVIEGTPALGLAAVAVDRPRLDATLVQLLGEAIGAVLGADEEQGAAVAPGNCGGDVDLVFLGHGEGAVFHRAGSIRVDRSCVHCRVAQVLGRQLLDASVQGGREQKTLGRVRDGPKDARDCGQESEVRHVVGLIDGEDTHLGQRTGAPLHVILEAARRRDDDVGASSQCLQLSVHGCTSVDRKHRHSVSARDPFDGVGHLLR